MPCKLTYDGVCPLLPLRVMGRHKDERLEKAITMALNSGGAMPFKAAWAKCGKPGTWKSAPRHLRELSSMSVESVCSSSSSRAAPACEQAQSASLSERGVAIYMYWDVFSEQGAVWQLPPVLRISTALQSLNSAFLHLLRRHGGEFGVRGRVRRSSMYDCSSQRMRRSRRGCRWC